MWKFSNDPLWQRDIHDMSLRKKKRINYLLTGNSMRILNGCEVRIESSVMRVTLASQAVLCDAEQLS